MRLAIVAVGGNALVGSGERGTAGEELGHARTVAKSVVDMIADGWSVVVTHGNGPQVGFIQRRAELAAELDRSLPPLALDLCVAETQGGLGYLLAMALSNELRARGRRGEVVAVVTRCVVDPRDEAFRTPTKPVGPRTARRLVASPMPISIEEAGAIEQLIGSGHTVVAVGGGGVPVVRGRDGSERGVEAVIDKDLASALLATALRADLLVLCTDVPAVAVDLGRPTQRWLDRLDTATAERLLAEGQFPPGNMGPKVRAALRFIRATNGWGEAVITSIERITGAVAGTAGTRFVAEHAPAAIQKEVRT